MPVRKILFLGETYRPDAITWMEGLREFGAFEIVTWELKTPSSGFFRRMLRIFEYSKAVFCVRNLVKRHRPDMVIAERTTSYGFLAALCSVRPVAIAQQGITDLWPEDSPLMPVKKIIRNYAISKADLIHAWGNVIAASMERDGADMKKVLVLPKGIRLDIFSPRQQEQMEPFRAIVTRSLSSEYRHETIIKAFGILSGKGFNFTLTIAGDGIMANPLKALSVKEGIADKVIFAGRIPNKMLAALLQQTDIYISMPVTEGVSSSLFEAMACGCYPILSDVPGNRSFVRHRENGQIVNVDDAEMLAGEILWAAQNQGFLKKATAENQKYITLHADYSVNMKIIADRYHRMIDEVKKQADVRN